MNACPKILKEQFPKDTALGQTMSFQIEGRQEFIRILHTGVAHWLTISTIGAPYPEVFVYDSMLPSTDSRVKQQMSCLLSSIESNISISVMDTHMQSGGNDCGVYAVACAAALCLGKNPYK